MARLCNTLSKFNSVISYYDSVVYILKVFNILTTFILTERRATLYSKSVEIIQAAKYSFHFALWSARITGRAEFCHMRQVG